MSTKPTVRNPSILRLIEEGYEVELVDQHLLVHSIPYLDSKFKVKLGTLACPYTEIGDEDTRPQDHTMWFRAETPHMSNGNPMNQVINNSTAKELFRGFVANHYLSNKPNGQPFINFYDKVNHYHTLFVSQARSKQPNADGRTGVIHRERDTNSIFQYPDTASSRVGITAVTQKLEDENVAIIGIGGTGSYILDMLAKTPIKEIHLFDGDYLEPHNAFRAPGAIAFENLEKKPKKVNYFCDLYSNLHKGIVAHDLYVQTDNLELLQECSFVFISIDSGIARREIVSYLIEKGIPFIDVGLGIESTENEDSSTCLRGSCRVTLVTPNKQNHINNHLTFVDDDPEQAIYNSNIQVADMNAMNAMMAISRWKQFKEFYHADMDNAHNLTYTISFQSISRSETS